MKNCCKKPKKGYEGILYGIIPHIGCIAFVVFTVLGVTAATAVFKPLLMSSYFFYILILISFALAAISASIYLKRNDSLSITGIKHHSRYLSILFGTTIAVNLLLFLVIFPYTANIGPKQGLPSGVLSLAEPNKLTLSVAIPCPGHASLITGELNKLGVSSKFRMPNYFDVTYDSEKISVDDILALDIFKTYNAKILG